MIDRSLLSDAAVARQLYLNNLDPNIAAADWRFGVRDARRLVADALRASCYLSDISRALQESCAHSLVFRHLLAPPLSQDQFKLICPLWKKNSENNAKPLDLSAADSAERIISVRLDRGFVKNIPKNQWISRSEAVKILQVIPSRIALQKLSTSKRSRLSLEQEYSVVTLLEKSGWKQIPSKLIDTRALVPPYHFMHKTRFATKTTAPQEVDIACGLKSSFVLALECKVTNDETNSVKRVNDVLKKASAWKEHWGSFVITAALLQGVIAAKDAQRLVDGGVEVFWSHDLLKFQTWLSDQMS